MSQNTMSSQLIKDLRLSASTVLTLPLLASGHPLIALVLILLSLVFSILAFSYLTPRSESHTSGSSVPSSPAIAALSKFLIPSSSIWPESYLTLPRSAEQHRGRSCITLDMETTFRDIRQGLIELRNPSIDLPLLLRNQLQIDGWNLSLDLSFKAKVRTWKWAVTEDFALLPDEAFPKPCTFAEKDQMTSVERVVLEDYCALFYELDESITVWPSLDYIPRSSILRFIHFFQKSLKTMHLKHRTSILSFTTTEANFSTFDDAFIYASIPFSRALSKDQDDARRKAAFGLRFSTPLFTRLPKVLALLTSGPTALRVLSLSNASASYANALDAYAIALEYDEIIRRECIRVKGVQGWREERLYARWEAALLRAGVLTRWVVLLDVNK